MTRVATDIQQASLPLRVLAAGGAALAALALATGNAAAGNTSVGDRVGENANAQAADISGVSVDDNGSQIDFRVDFANRTSLQQSEAVYIYIDADSNRSTGDTGSDFRIQAFGGTQQIRLARFAGGSWDDSGPAISASFGSSLTASVPASALGNTTGFDFFVATVWQGSIADFAPDNAPSGERLHHALTASSPAPQAAPAPAPVAQPAAPAVQPAAPAMQPAAPAMQPAAPAMQPAAAPAPDATAAPEFPLVGIPAPAAPSAGIGAPPAGVAPSPSPGELPAAPQPAGQQQPGAQADTDAQSLAAAQRLCGPTGVPESMVSALAPGQHTLLTRDGRCVPVIIDGGPQSKPGASQPKPAKPVKAKAKAKKAKGSRRR